MTLRLKIYRGFDSNRSILTGKTKKEDTSKSFYEELQQQ